MVGGHFSLSSNNFQNIYKHALNQILLKYKLKFNVYKIIENRKQILIIEVFIKNKDLLLMELSGELNELENYISNNIQVEYRIKYKEPD